MSLTLNTVNVVGMGYIGLPTATVLAENGFRVHGTDVNEATVSAISAGSVPFAEPDLAAHVERAVRSGRLTASTRPLDADAYVIAVPTPSREDRTPDVSFIEGATRAIAPYLTRDCLVILESTSPPGTTEQVGMWIGDLRPDLVDHDGSLAVQLAHCPERVLPGRVMVELITNDRIIGGVTPEAAISARSLYATFSDGEIHLTDARTAELAKLVENSYRDVNIAFANELSLIADRLEVDVWEVIQLANRHPRVNVLQPGPGVGGHCIAVDPWFIVDAAPDLARLIRTAREVNDEKPDWVMSKVRAAVAGIDAPVIATLGLTFKPDVDDLRESPARRIAAAIADEFVDGRVLVVEPNITALPNELANRRNVQFATLPDAAARADVTVLLVDHREFRMADPLALGIAADHLIDTRGVWSRLSR